MYIELCNLTVFKKVAQQTVAFHWPRPSNFVAHDAAHSPTLHLEDGEYTGTHRPKIDEHKYKSSTSRWPGHDEMPLLISRQLRRFRCLQVCCSNRRPVFTANWSLICANHGLCFSQDRRYNQKPRDLGDWKLELIAQRSYNCRNWIIRFWATFVNLVAQVQVSSAMRSMNSWQWRRLMPWNMRWRFEVIRQSNTSCHIPVPWVYMLFFQFSSLLDLFFWNK